MPGHRRWSSVGTRSRTASSRSGPRGSPGGLAELGIGRGDRVALWLPNCPEWLVLHLALARLGALSVAVNTRFRAHEVQDILTRSEATALALWPGLKDFEAILEEVDAPATILRRDALPEARARARRAPTRTRR